MCALQRYLALAVASISGFSITPPTCAQEPAGWKMSDFVVYLWGTPEIADLKARAAALESAGFSVVDWEPGDLDVLREYQLMAMIHRPTPELAKQLAGHAGVWGYHCADEPWPESTFNELAIQIRQLKQADSGHPAFINMLSIGGEYLRTYMSQVEPEFLSFDYYQWWWGTDRFFEKLEQFREAAQLAGVPWGSCVETTANPLAESGDTSYIDGNATRLRHSVYANLAYGAKSIEWFAARYMYEPNSSELTRSGRDVVALNRELHSLGPVLVDLTSVDVFHSRPVYSGTRTFPRDYWIQVSGEAHKASVLAGIFVDEANKDYLFLVNCDCERPNNVAVRLQSKWLGNAPWNKEPDYRYSVRWFDRTTGDWKPISSSSSQGFVWNLAAGDGELFQIETEIEEP